MKHESFWLTEVPEAYPRASDLPKDLKVDVAIVGAGFVGLWTAYWLKLLEPSLRVAIFEKSVAGHGASARNGGFVMSWWPKIGRLAAIAGDDDAKWLADETTANVGAIGDILRKEGIEAEFQQAGWLWTATSEAHRGAWRTVLEKAAALGRDGVFREIPAGEVAARTGSSKHIEGVWEPINGKVQPAKLGVGLAATARRLGVEIYENRGVDAIEPGATVRLRIGAETVRADRVVIASNIAAVSYKELSRGMVLVTSAIVATRPIPDRLAEIGWAGGETITDSQTRLNYYRTTASGRIVYGMGVGRLSFGNALSDTVYDDREGIRITEANFRRVYPALGSVPVEYGWSGPIDRTYDGLPLIGQFPNAPNIVYGVGWSGNGVGPSRVGARIMAGLALGLSERWTTNAFVNRIGRPFPPEPFRYVGGSVIRAAVARKDDSEIAGRSVPRLARSLARLAPAGTEDKG